MNKNEKTYEEIAVSEVKKSFPGHTVNLMAFEDSSILVRLYDIPDDEVKAAKKRVWDILDAKLGKADCKAFAPSIVSHSNTVKYYPSHLAGKEICE